MGLRDVSPRNYHACRCAGSINIKAALKSCKCNSKNIFVGDVSAQKICICKNVYSSFYIINKWKQLNLPTLIPLC